MPGKTSPGAGRYRVTATHWTRRHEDGRVTRYYYGDTVELTDAEATRLAGTKRFQGAVKVEEQPDQEQEKKSESQTQQTSSGRKVSESGSGSGS